MMKKLAIAVIPEQYTPLFIETAKASGTGRLITFSGRGTAGKALLERLGIGATKKNLIVFLSCEKTITTARALWEQKAAEHTDCGGILFTVWAEKNIMAKKSEYTLICIIVNSGYGETVMQAARKAGAPGGTIIDAKGTGTEQDMNFFGIEIVREKEAVLIVAETSAVSSITDAVKKLACFEKEGSGIICTLAADSCFHLGASSS